MNDERRERLERRVAFLQEERDAALDALDLAGELGVFSLRAPEGPSRDELLRDVCARAGRLLPFEATSVLLLNEADGDFVAAITEPLRAAADLDADIRELIADQSFAHALRADGPVAFPGRDRKRRVLLHVLATRTRVVGMFAGRLAERGDAVPDIPLKLLSVVMLAAAHALENLEMRRLLERHNRRLDRMVRERTAELGEAYERLRTTVDGMQAGVLLVDAESRTVVDANPEVARLLGLPREAIVGRSCREYFCPNRGDACPVIDRDEAVNSVERTMRNAEGETIPLLKTVSRVSVDGRPHLVESFIDITQQKKLETLRADVDRIMRHDLKGPLNGVIGLPSLILATGENLNEEQRESLRFIRSAGRKLLRMINMSMDLYKMETGVYVYAPEPRDLLAVVREAAADLEDAASAAGVAVALTLEGEPVARDAAFPLPCEDFLLYSLLSNLMRNAVEGSGIGDVAALDVRRRGRDAVVTVRNARPVPEAIRETLFQKYVTSGKPGGTGLGAYSARLIAETMGGRIECETSEERGTTMTVTLPGQPRTRSRKAVVE